MMKQFLAILLACVLTVPAFAGYTYVVTDGMDFSGKTLNTGQSLLMTGGGGRYLNLYGGSFAVIQGTAPYNQNIYPSGGIYEIRIADYANLDISGGEVYDLAILAYGTATLSGGTIQRLQTSQIVGQDGPHVTILCKEWDYNITTKMLTGTWGDDSAFAIRLVDVQGYTPTIDNIQFTIIPEPLTLFIFAAGGVLLPKRQRR